MLRMIDSRPVFLVCRLLLGTVFIYAGISKIGDPAAFAEIIYNYKILPSALVNVIAIVLPWIEVMAGALVILGRVVLPASGILTVLLFVFFGAIAFNLARGLDFQCGCFSMTRAAADAGWLTLFRDALFLLPALICFRGAWIRTRSGSTMVGPEGRDG